MTGIQFLQNMGCIGYIRAPKAAKSGILYLEGVDADSFTLGRIFAPKGATNLSSEDFLTGEVEVSSKDETSAFLRGRISKEDIDLF